MSQGSAPFCWQAVWAGIAARHAAASENTAADTVVLLSWVGNITAGMSHMHAVFPFHFSPALTFMQQLVTDQPAHARM